MPLRNRRDASSSIYFENEGLRYRVQKLEEENRAFRDANSSVHFENERLLYQSHILEEKNRALEDASSSIHCENERLLHQIQRMEEDKIALDLNLTSSLRKTEAAFTAKERADAKYAELLQHENNNEAHTASLQTQNQQYLHTIIQLEMKLDSRMEEKNKLKETNKHLTASIEEKCTELSEKTKMVTQLEKNLVNLSADLQVYEYFTRIGISLRHRALELEHMPFEQDQSLIDEGNKVLHSSACLADAQLYLTREQDNVPLTQQSHLKILLGEPRSDSHIYKKLYGAWPTNVANLADVEEFVQMVDYRGAMFKFLGQAQYVHSRFAALVEEMNELIRGKRKDVARSVFQSEKGQQILTEMGQLYNGEAEKHSQARV